MKISPRLNYTNCASFGSSQGGKQSIIALSGLAMWSGGGVKEPKP